MLKIFKFMYLVRSDDYGDQLLDCANETEAKELIRNAANESYCNENDPVEGITYDDRGIYEAITSKKYESLGYTSVADINDDDDEFEDGVELSARNIDGCEPAIVGVTEDGERLVYDYDLLIETLMKNSNCNETAAIEWYEYNIVRSFPYFQPSPIILHRITDYTVDDTKALIDAIDEGLSNRYVVLEGDRETLYVKDRQSEKHFAIHVDECTD